MATYLRKLIICLVVVFVSDSDAQLWSLLSLQVLHFTLIVVLQPYKDGLYFYYREIKYKYFKILGEFSFLVFLSLAVAANKYYESELAGTLITN
jgi:hypothetical protein